MSRLWKVLVVLKGSRARFFSLLDIFPHLLISTVFSGLDGFRSLVSKSFFSCHCFLRVIFQGSCCLKRFPLSDTLHPTRHWCLKLGKVSFSSRTKGRIKHLKVSPKSAAHGTTHKNNKWIQAREQIVASLKDWKYESWEECNNKCSGT